MVLRFSEITSLSFGVLFRKGVVPKHSMRIPWMEAAWVALDPLQLDKQDPPVCVGHNMLKGRTEEATREVSQQQLSPKRWLTLNYNVTSLVSLLLSLTFVLSSLSQFPIPKVEITHLWPSVSSLNLCILVWTVLLGSELYVLQFALL